ncbi:MAG: hypothetical protein JWQ81_1887 [Amycolatopsis sp.]|nr:hypothetical protein [Amycolatopsis sp.]MCU1681148.1 hypothetical protein [Amycolatopsis sp.]
MATADEADFEENPRSEPPSRARLTELVTEITDAEVIEQLVDRILPNPGK